MQGHSLQERWESKFWSSPSLVRDNNSKNLEMRHTTLACFAYNHQTAKLVPHTLDHKEIFWGNEIKLISPSGRAPWFCHYKSSVIFSCKQLCPCPAPAEDAAAFLLCSCVWLLICVSVELFGFPKQGCFQVTTMAVTALTVTVESYRTEVHSLLWGGTAGRQGHSMSFLYHFPHQLLKACGSALACIFAGFSG